MGVAQTVIPFGAFRRSGDTDLTSYPAGTVTIIKLPDATLGQRPQAIVGNLLNSSSSAMRIYVHAGSTLSTVYNTGNRISFVSLVPAPASVSYQTVQPNAVGKFVLNPLVLVSSALVDYLAVIVTDSSGNALSTAAGSLTMVSFEGRFDIRYP